MAKYKLIASGVQLGGLNIPNSPDNRHWVEYQTWLAEGNIPDPADPDPIPVIPPPTMTQLLQALDAKDKGNSTDWDAIVLEENKKPRKVP